MEAKRTHSIFITGHGYASNYISHVSWAHSTRVFATYPNQHHLPSVYAKPVNVFRQAAEVVEAISDGTPTFHLDT